MVGVVDQHVCRLDVLVNEALAVHASESRRQPDGDAQDASQFERLSFVPLEDPSQRLAAGIRERLQRVTNMLWHGAGPSTVSATI